MLKLKIGTPCGEFTNVYALTRNDSSVDPLADGGVSLWSLGWWLSWFLNLSPVDERRALEILRCSRRATDLSWMKTMTIWSDGKVCRREFCFPLLVYELLI